jgi:M6 family metalloprotease-like protein
VVRVDFSDKGMTSAGSLTNAQTFFTNVRAFYAENSYTTFLPVFTVTNRTSGGSAGLQGSYRLGLMSTYGADCGSDVACNDPQLFSEATAAAAVDYTMTNFDQIMIYHAGDGQETLDPKLPETSSHIWSVYLPTPSSAGGKSFPGFTIVPETEGGNISPLGVICHEYGHQIGLPYLYDTSGNGGQSTVGAFDVMDYPYSGGNPVSSNPPHLGAWSKKFLGWALPTMNQKGTLTLLPAETTQTAFNQIDLAAFPKEYFLMEYRLRAAAVFGGGVPMDGLALWHVDDSIALDPALLSENSINTPSKSGRGHRGVDLVEADGTGIFPPNDLGNGNAFTDNQTAVSPQTNAFNGQPSGLAVHDRPPPGHRRAAARGKGSGHAEPGGR